jgi:threonine dehydratase
VKTQAEGLASARAYELPFKIFREKLDEIVLVGDDELYAGVRILFQTIRQVAELSGAASVAAALQKEMKEVIRSKKVVLMLTGGNISQEMFSRIIGK